GRQELEYTRADILPVDSKFEKSNERFFHRFGEAARTLRIEDYLGVCLLERRNFPIDQLVETEVESTDVLRPANIITVRARDRIRTEHFYETTWQIHRESNMSCPTTCCSYCTPRIPGHQISHHTVHPTPD